MSLEASCFIDQNLISLVERLFPGLWNLGQRKLAACFVNVPAHNSKLIRNLFEHNPLKRLPQPPYPPHSSPLDVDLFGELKIAMTGQEILDDTGLFEIVTEFLDGISVELPPSFVVGLNLSKRN
jgi:hypothetical protein